MEPAPQISAGASAALLVLLMDETDAAQLLGRLSSADLQRLSQCMCTMQDVDPATIRAAIATFARAAAKRGVDTRDNPVKVHALMTQAIGPVRAESLMKRVVPPLPAKPHGALELIRWLNHDILSAMLADEHPQAVALTLLHLDADIAAQVLADLPSERQADIVHRIATLGPVMPVGIALLEEVLAKLIERDFGHLPQHLGGVIEAAELINRSGKITERAVMPQIALRDEPLAKSLELALFRFDKLLRLDPQMMGQLLREVDNDTLVDALKGIAEDERHPFYAAMSSRAADGLKDEIETRGRVKRAEAEAAQARIIAIARKLVDEGVLILDEGGGDYV